jgi:hypothetical protein
VVVVIHIVDSDVAVIWLLEQGDLPPTAELLCPLPTGDLGWCATEDLCIARDVGTERIGQMSLHQCGLMYEQHHGAPIAAVRCGEFALTIRGNRDPKFRGEDLLLTQPVQVQQVGWTHTSELLNAFSGGGPIPPIRPAPVTRGCKAMVTTVLCDWWVTLPPPPSPCPNPNLATHNFV